MRRVRPRLPRERAGLAAPPDDGREDEPAEVAVFRLALEDGSPAEPPTLRTAVPN